MGIWVWMGIWEEEKKDYGKKACLVRGPRCRSVPHRVLVCPSDFISHILSLQGPTHSILRALRSLALLPPAAPCRPPPTIKLALTTPPPLLASPTLPSGRKRMPTPRPLFALAAQTTSQRSRRQVRFLPFRPALLPRTDPRPRASSHQPRERRPPASGVMSTHGVPTPGRPPGERAP